MTGRPPHLRQGGAGTTSASRRQAGLAQFPEHRGTGGPHQDAGRGGRRGCRGERVPREPLEPDLE